MVFSSVIFVFYFLPLTLSLYYAVPRHSRHLVLTVGSYVFYGWANPLFVVLLLFSTFVDYLCGLVIVGSGPVWLARLLGATDVAKCWCQPLQPLRPHTTRSRRQRLALICSLCSNLALLGFFKYFNFGIESYDRVISFVGLDHLQLQSTLQVTLPLGISFYTFQSMSYTIDIFRGQAGAVRQFIDFACYVSLFPQLVAGPIIRFSEIADQLRLRSSTLVKFTRGITFFSIGLFKKIWLANPCGQVADIVFDSGFPTALDAWCGVIAYSFQIYFDFSAYSDMAIGLGLMLGFVFPKNFDSPYQSASVTEFWQRWHISLSSWLRDYLYIPLGGSRSGKNRTYINLFVVMLLGGLWHGAAWTFVIWGGLHGTLLALERTRGKTAFYDKLPHPVRVFITFNMVSIGWVFFRANDLGHATRFLQSMFWLRSSQPPSELISGILYQPYFLITLGISAIVIWSCPQTWDWGRQLTVPRAILTSLALAASLALLATQAYNPFLYFIF